MNLPSTRREFLKTSTKVAAVSALAGVALPQVHAAGTDTVQVALIGCGGRGGGAAANALSVKNGPMKMVAAADVLDKRLNPTLAALESRHKERMDVGDKKFIGFDGYQHAIDALKPGDIAILATPPAFRWVHFQYAIQKGVNVFMEKPVCVDAGSGARMLKLGEEASRRGLKVGVGLMCRHCRIRQELFDRIRQGEAGELLMMRAYRQHPPGGSFRSERRAEGMSELMFQIQRFHGFIWASGGCFSDFYIHNIDEACWMKNDWPIMASAAGGRHYRDKWVDQNLDTYSVEYTFPDGTKLFFEGRNMAGCRQEFATYAHGTKGLAVVSSASHAPARSKIFKGHLIKSENLVWGAPKVEPDPYQLEWDDLVDAVRNNKPYNEVEHGVKASLVAAMGRWAAHTGQIVTMDDFVAAGQELAPNVDELTLDGPSPLKELADGKYPVPQPGQSGPDGQWREYYV